MPSPFVGEIHLFAGDYVPVGWIPCTGELLPISKNQELYQVIGTTYGGDGRSTFAVPDLRSRLPISEGTNAGTDYELGSRSGEESVSLSVNQLPSHSHAVKATTQAANTGNPADAHLAKFGSGSRAYAVDAANEVAMDSDTISFAGGGKALPIRQPSLCVTFIMAAVGTMP